MKNIVNNFRSQPLHNKVLAVVYLLIALAMPFIIGMKPANAQSGNVYAVPQAQAAGDTYEAVVLQVSRKEVEPSFQARAAGAAAGSALGLALASRSGTHNRFAVNTVGAVLGGVLGERSSNALMKNEAQEIVVQLGAAMPGRPLRIVTIVQPAPFEPVYQGEMVYVSMIKGAYRVFRRNAPVGSGQPL